MTDVRTVFRRKNHMKYRHNSLTSNKLTSVDASMRSENQHTPEVGKCLSASLHMQRPPTGTTTNVRRLVMNKRIFLSLLLTTLFAAPAMFATCRICSSTCMNAATGVSGWTGCDSNNAGCAVSGGQCTGNGGGEDGGFCDPTTEVCSRGFLRQHPSMMLASFRTSSGEGRSWVLVDVAVRTAESSQKLEAVVR